ncbi:unnamed protein product [Caenorhabditis sp. 36 PRJEB53466]|nr:unnamed protein product [Caenorhabditis sp. 36 PRJEB53466]
MPSNQTNSKKMSKKAEEPSNVQKLLASLQQAQNKSVEPSGESSSTKPKKKKGGEEKKKPKGPSVGARMQQQAESARMQSKRPRHVSTSKVGRAQTIGEQPQPQSSHQQYRGPRIPTDVLDELEFRFVSNMVDYEINNKIRACFHLEVAHWYYIDHMVEGDYTGCPNVGLREFTTQMLYHCKALHKYSHDSDEFIAQFRDYKSTVPTYGAILMDESLDYVLLVQSYFAKGNSWGFPKGKINQNEPPRDAAIRECYEETGFDFGRHSENEKKLQKFQNETMVRLYIVKNVPKDYNFQPQTRKEIRKIQWFKVDDLPTDKTDQVPTHLRGYKFYLVMPFVNDIRTYARKEKEKMKKKPLEKVPAPAPPAPVPSTSSILSQLFPNVPLKANTSEEPTPLPPAYKRLTSEELFTAFKPPPPTGTSEISRPTLPDMSPSVDGMDSLAVLGLCTPLKPGANLNQFSISPQNCPMISEESGGQMEYYASGQAEEIGFAMPTDLKQPLVTSDHPWHNKIQENSAPPQTIESHQGWLDTQLVNTIMHSPNTQMPSSPSPATPTAVLGHLIGKPIQPQAIFPQAATPTAMGSAEKPKSSRISLSDNSAFKAISAPKHSVPKATAPPSAEKTRSSSLSGPAEPRKAARNLLHSVVSPASSGLTSVHGDEASMWEVMWYREQLGTTAGTSISSLAASNQELAMINRDTPVEDRNIYMQQVYESAGNQQRTDFIPKCHQWTKRIQLDVEYIAGPAAFWKKQFSVSNN